MDNPLTGKPLSKEAADYVATIKEARRNARKVARSGNPAVSGPARAVIAAAPKLVAAVYAQEAGR